MDVGACLCVCLVGFDGLYGGEGVVAFALKHGDVAGQFADNVCVFTCRMECQMPGACGLLQTYIFGGVADKAVTLCRQVEMHYLVATKIAGI